MVVVLDLTPEYERYNDLLERGLGYQVTDDDAFEVFKAMVQSYFFSRNTDEANYAMSEIVGPNDFLDVGGHHQPHLTQAWSSFSTEALEWVETFTDTIDKFLPGYDHPAGYAYKADDVQFRGKGIVVVYLTQW